MTLEAVYPLWEDHGYPRRSRRRKNNACITSGGSLLHRHGIARNGSMRPLRCDLSDRPHVFAVRA